MQHIVVTGGTGFIGRHLSQALLARGDRVSVLSRSGRGGAVGAATVRRWTPLELGDWAEVIDGCDAVVHLAGEQVVGRRMTQGLRRAIWQSRVEGTTNLVQAIERARRRPRVLVSASAVGYYGGRLSNEPLDENAPAGSDFMAELCVAWEGAARRAAGAGVRVVTPRFGVTLGGDGGSLPVIARAFRAFAGGHAGSGEQCVSWIHIDDMVQVLLRCLDDERLQGPVNATAPNAVENRQFSAAIGRALRRPSWLRVPAVALKLALGDGAEAVLTGQNAVPARLRQIGFQWRYADIDAAVQAALRPPAARAS